MKNEEHEESDLCKDEDTNKETINRNHEDDDEEDDDDYNPDEDKNKDDDEEGDDDALVPPDEKNKIPTCNLSKSKLRVVDEAFESLFGYKYGTSFYQPDRRQSQQKPDQKILRYKEKETMESLFGPVVAARLLATRHYVTKKEEINAKVGFKDENDRADEEEIVTELKKYAGKIITVKTKRKKRKMEYSSSAAPQQQKKKGIDSLLKELNGPSKLSTVAKTSSDWDTFKSETGVEEELEQKAQGKGAYLQKQDFLNRVDHRRFVEEKQEREDKRRKRGK